MATLINGNGNTPVTAQQDADFFQGVLGGNFVKMLPVGSQMAYTIEDANTITLADGECVDSEGRRIHIDYGYTDSFTIPTGTSGTTAYYIIGYYISTDSDGNETAEAFVQAMSSATATIDEGSLRDGDSSKYVSLYRVTQTSLTISSVEALFTTIVGFADALPFGFAIQSGSYGYLDTDGDFHSFRNATGTATAAQVLSGYTFTNASSDNITGTMNNWGSNTVTMSSNTATLSAGYYSGITINAASRYTAGYNAHAMTRTLLYNCTYSYTSGSSTTPTATTSGSLNAAAYIDDYANLTAANFALVTTRVTGVSLVRENATYLSTATWYYVSANRSLSYNASNGMVTLNIANASYEVSGHNTVAGTADSYLVYCYHA